MMAKKKFDELNILSASDDSSDVFDYHDFIEHYFDPMQISERQKRKRIEAAEDLFDTILYFLSWCEEFSDKVQEEETKEEFENRYRETVFQYGEPDSYFDSYISLFVSNLLKTTLDHQGEEYFTSVERASNLAVNESNTVIQYEELKDAIEQGFNVKIWQTQLDNRVRDSHAILEGVKKGIFEYFSVGNSMLLFPRDEHNYTDLSDIAGCRCSLRFEFNERYPVYKINSIDVDITNSQKYEVENDAIRDESDVTEYSSVNGKITAHRYIESDNVYLSDNLHIEPEKIAEIQSKVDVFKKYVGMPNDENFKIIIIDFTELQWKTAGVYDYATNSLIYKYMADEKELNHTILHELYHWKDAYDYQLENGVIPNKFVLIEYERVNSKAELDRLGINGNNVGKITPYAEYAYEIGKYEEVYTEYRTVKDLGELDDNFNP